MEEEKIILYSNNPDWGFAGNWLCYDAVELADARYLWTNYDYVLAGIGASGVEQNITRKASFWPEAWWVTIFKVWRQKQIPQYV